MGRTRERAVGRLRHRRSVHSRAGRGGGGAVAAISSSLLFPGSVARDAGVAGATRAGAYVMHEVGAVVVTRSLASASGRASCRSMGSNPRRGVASDRFSKVATGERVGPPLYLARV
jgi:hypothetical protein